MNGRAEKREESIQELPQSMFWERYRTKPFRQCWMRHFFGYLLYALCKSLETADSACWLFSGGRKFLQDHHQRLLRDAVKFSTTQLLLWKGREKEWKPWNRTDNELMQFCFLSRQQWRWQSNFGCLFFRWCSAQKMNSIIVTLLLGEYHRLHLTRWQHSYFPASSRLLRPVSCHKDTDRILPDMLQTDFAPSVWFCSAINCDRPFACSLEFRAPLN